MISNTPIISIIILGIISISLPLIFLIYFIRKYPSSWKPILVGFCVFIVFSQVLEGALHLLVSFINPQTHESTNNPYFSALYVSLSSGIFQEVGRYLGFYYVLKKHRSWKDGMAYGVGHGGVEALIIGGMAAISSIVIIILSHFGFLEQLISVSEPSMALELMKSEQMANFPSSFFLLISLERISIFIIQLGLSLFVLYGVTKQKTSYLLYAIYIHTIVYFLPALLLRMDFSTYWQEAYFLIMAVISLIFIYKSKAMFAHSEKELEHR